MSSGQLHTGKGPDGTRAGEEITSPSSGQIKSIFRYLDEDGLPNVNNFDGDKVQKWRLQALATGATCKGFDELPKEGIALKYFFAHRIEMASSRGGEIITPVRIVLIDNDNRAYGFVSDFLARGIDDLIGTFGWGPWELPALVKVTKATSRKGQSFYSLEPAV